MRKQRKLHAQCANALCLLAALLAAMVGCSDTGTNDPIVGSSEVTTLRVDTDVVERLTISLPFEARISSGKPMQVLLRGEDNLLEEITVEETVVGNWRIEAPQDLSFTQHHTIEIEVPYLDMVRLQLDGKDLELVDRPLDGDSDAGADGG